jgi:flagellar hook-associated protein 3
MDIRVTPQTQVALALASLRRQTDQLGVLQTEMGTGNRINLPSDDPIGTINLMANQTQDVQLTTYLSSINDTQSSLNQGVSSLRSVDTILSSARDIANQGANSTNDASADEALAEQVDGLLSNLLSIANSKDGTQYQFSGTATQTAPFVVTTTDAQGRPTAVSYVGAADQVRAAVSPQENETKYYAGSDAFQSRQRGTTNYFGDTGATAGTGTDSATGQGTLLVSHTSTVYAPGSGVTAGASSAAGDTIIGPLGANTLTIDDTSGNGTAGTIALNGGAPIAFSSANTDLKITGPKGEVVFVNTSNITPGFNGAVNITANGTLSVDGGATTVPINFSANQVVKNGTTGDVTNVNSTNIRLAGADQVSYTGTYDAFQILMALRDDLRNTQGLPDSQRLPLISSRIAEIDRMTNGVLSVVGRQSASLVNLQALQNQTKTLQLNEQTRTSNIQGADISSVVIGFQAQQNLLQLTLAAAARFNQETLLQFLQ